MVSLKDSKLYLVPRGAVTVNHDLLRLIYRYDVDIWGPMAERIAEQVPKGSWICVQGKLNPATWTNREGVKQTKFKVDSNFICSCWSWVCSCGVLSVCILQISASEVRFIQREQQPPGAQQQQGGWGQQQQQVGRPESAVCYQTTVVTLQRGPLCVGPLSYAVVTAQRQTALWHTAVVQH